MIFAPVSHASCRLNLGASTSRRTAIIHGRMSTRDAHLQAWDDAARLVDDKWEHVLGPVLEEFRTHVAGHLRLPDRASIAVAPNTHEFLTRILSCFATSRPISILTSDGEFHSFSRQIARLEEEAAVTVSRVPLEPFTTFEERFLSAARTRRDLVFVSHVFFNSGFALDIGTLNDIAEEAMLIIDGIMALWRALRI